RKLDGKERRRSHIPNGVLPRVETGTAQRVFSCSGSKRSRQVGEPVGRVGASGIGTGDNRRLRSRDSHIAPARDRTFRELQAAGLVTDGDQARILLPRFEKPLPGAVRRTAVDYDDLRWRGNLGEKAGDDPANVLDLVQFCDHDAHRNAGRPHGSSIASESLWPHAAEKSIADSSEEHPPTTITPPDSLTPGLV